MDSQGRTDPAPPGFPGKLLQELNNTGPLDIADLDDFLLKSKVDFQNFYKDKTVSDYTISDFTLIRQLGSGSFGTVVLARPKDSEDLYAIKVLNKKAILKGKQFHYVFNEKRILQSLNFPFVVYLKFFFMDFNNLYFAMPFISGGDFKRYLKNCGTLPENHARFFTSQLVLALEYIHYLELIHRDVKPENIVIDATGYIKLADFGQCVRCSGKGKAWTFTGTAQYMAPEIINGCGYDFAVDWWALGVTLFEMCAGRRPFKHTKTGKLFELVVKVQYDMPQGFSDPLKVLIESLLTEPAARRICAEGRGAKELKRHHWFQDTDWAAILNRSLPSLRDSRLTIRKHS